MRIVILVIATLGILSACAGSGNFQGDRMAVGQDSELGRLNNRLAGDRNPL